MDIAFLERMLLCRTFAGAWIETMNAVAAGGAEAVAPLRVRGLKHLAHFVYLSVVCRTFAGAWIET